MALRIVPTHSELPDILHDVFKKLQEIDSSNTRMDYDLWRHEESDVDVLIREYFPSDKRVASEPNAKSVEALCMRSNDYVFVSSSHVNIPTGLLQKGILSRGIKQVYPLIFENAFGTPTARAQYQQVNNDIQGLVVKRFGISNELLVRYTGRDMFTY